VQACAASLLGPDKTAAVYAHMVADPFSSWPFVHATRERTQTKSNALHCAGADRCLHARSRALTIHAASYKFTLAHTYSLTHARPHTCPPALIMRNSQLTSGWIRAPDDQVVTPLELSPEMPAATAQVGEAIDIDSVLPLHLS
jgi:hypothetical protein